MPIVKGATMKYFFSAVTILGSVIGALILLFALASTDSAPQLGSLAAVAVGFAVIPYCITRSIEKVARDSQERYLRETWKVLLEIRQQAAQGQRNTITHSERPERERETITFPAKR